MNVSYGIPIGVGLWLIGIPNAILWGVLAAVLRFVPYIGAWIAAAFPLVISFAVSPSWNAPLLAQLLALGGLKADAVSAKALAGEMIEMAAELSPKLLCISAIPPTSVLPAQHLCRRLRERLGKETWLMIGLWNEAPGESARHLERFKRAQADEVFVKLGDDARDILLQADCTPVTA